MALNEKWFPVRRDTVKLPSGKIVDDYFIWEAPRIAMIIPVLQNGDFVIISQYRHAIGTITTQFPAGAIDAGETAEQAALRELEEETGYVPTGPAEHLVQVAPYSSKVRGTLDIFIVPAKPGGSPTYDEQEETDIFVVSAEELRKRIAEPKLQQEDFVLCALLALQHQNK